MSRVRLLAVALCGVMLVVYVRACFGAQPIFDDAWGIIHHWPGDLWSSLGREWVQPSYLAQGVDYPDQFAWGPLAMVLQDLLAAVTGRASITPFRLLNVAVFGATLVAVYGATHRLTSSTTVSAVAAAILCVHPVSAEVIPWSADLFDALAALCLAAGIWAALGARSDRSFILSSTVGFALALLSKPTAVSLGVVFPLLAALRHVPNAPGGAHVRTILLTGVAVLACAVTHQAIYATVAPWPLGRILASKLVDDAGARETLIIAWGASLLDAGVPRVPPSLFRFVVPEVAWPRGAAGIALVIGGAGLCVTFRARRWAQLLFVGLVVWAVGLLPGAYFSTLKGISALRYSYLPLVVALPVGAASAVAAFEDAVALGQLGVQSRRILTGGAWLVGALTSLTWASRSHDRVEAYGSMGALLQAELEDPAYDTEQAHGSVLRVLAAKSVWFDHITAVRRGASLAGPDGASLCAEGARYADAIARLEENPVFTRAEQVSTLISAMELNTPLLTERNCGSADHAGLVARVRALQR